MCVLLEINSNYDTGRRKDKKGFCVTQLTIQSLHIIIITNMEKVKNTFTSKKHLFLYILFILFTGWWIVLNYLIEPTDHALELFSGTYGLIALVGSIYGLRISKMWGGSKSLIGKSILLYSLGLLAQVFGQISYSLYTLVFAKEIPYPSIGDVGYMGSVLLYIWATFTLVKAVSVKDVAKSYSGKIQAILIPLVILVASYMFFLKGYEFDFSSPVTVFLDFGYPLGQAVYISLAILVYLLSRKYLGGVMRPVILFLIFALGLQYFADFMFLYQTNKETWTTAGANDYLYAVSYFVMSLALLRFEVVIKKLGQSNSSEGGDA